MQPEFVEYFAVPIDRSALLCAVAAHGWRSEELLDGAGRPALHVTGPFHGIIQTPLPDFHDDNHSHTLEGIYAVYGAYMVQNGQAGHA